MQRIVSEREAGDLLAVVDGESFLFLVRIHRPNLQTEESAERNQFRPSTLDIRKDAGRARLIYRGCRSASSEVVIAM